MWIGVLIGLALLGVLIYYTGSAIINASGDLAAG